MGCCALAGASDGDAIAVSGASLRGRPRRGAGDGNAAAACGSGSSAIAGDGCLGAFFEPSGRPRRRFKGALPPIAD